ncbi:DAK2 domain-containing protein [Ammoniphilus sp. 3BR4]|uniref:DAK2 domain-containing protein n=1 Tax=Ammoniphilus sp. 3BR4 TaxID=3158265 RepID=UPI0034668CCB
MNFKTISPLLVAFAERHKEKWNELDGAQGDGDLGVTMLLGAKALAESAETCHSVKEWFQVGGKALRKAAPSTMGILIASALIAAGKSIEPDQAELSLEDWVNIQQSMADEIQKRGGAKLGDKTVLDAFIPAVQIFREGVQRGKSSGQILTDVTHAAKKSAEETAAMMSKIGRSSWLGERAQGHVDGGAWVCYQLYEFALEMNQAASKKFMNKE